MDIIIITSLSICLLIAYWMYQRGLNQSKKDSPLRQKAILNANTQVTYMRLKQLLPEWHIMAQVPFDSLLTTKYLHTRRKYQELTADFVVLDQNYRTVAVVLLQDAHLMKRLKASHYREDILSMAGYRVLRYEGNAEVEQLQRDFMQDIKAVEQGFHYIEHDFGDSQLSMQQRLNRLRLSRI
ncbi:DUF2726 domain-containing protein [Acinetobacter larvae]|uniref:Uncharacterized protein n=1 Tax=Acinetobacter larvae TaxID=1789224 RepID=A0A1B2M3C5_9GAMM|nr:DUF2726 domain-containing protein [Acinetobacter larvae]AOA59697.1 hypothetical protein BFG52_15970 [Acinetobacter larvae]